MNDVTIAEIMTASGENDPCMAEDFEWDVDAEIQLFYAMFGHKPVGINKYFNMISIWEKLTHSISKEITTNAIWKHLDSLYDLNMLDDTEPIPFPNDEVEFSLPETTFGELMRQKVKDGGISTEYTHDRSASPRIHSTPRSISRGATSRENTPKASGRFDPRRDSRDSNVSAGGRESTGSAKSSGKGSKGTKTKERFTKSRLSSTDDTRHTPDSNASGGSKRSGAKRPTRGSTARAGGEATPPLVPTPPGMKRRRI